jgi:transcriptional regulator with XRE-family HTH domain
MNISETIGEKIRQIRQLKGLSQENMADMLNISAIAYGDIERGKQIPKLSRLEDISSALGVTLNDLLNFGDRVNNFFENCQEPYVNNNTYGNNNYYKGDKTLQNELERIQKESEKKDLIIETLSAKIQILEMQLKSINRP